MTAEQVELLKLGITPVDDKLCLVVESALVWVQNHTTLSFDITSDDDLAALPANVRLFAAKYAEIMKIRFGIASESISNLSQSFNTGDFADLLSSLADELLDEYVKPDVSFVSAIHRFKPRRHRRR